MLVPAERCLARAARCAVFSHGLHGFTRIFFYAWDWRPRIETDLHRCWFLRSDAWAGAARFALGLPQITRIYTDSLPLGIGEHRWGRIITDTGSFGTLRNEAYLCAFVVSAGGYRRCKLEIAVEFAVYALVNFVRIEIDE